MKYIKFILPSAGEFSTNVSVFSSYTAVVYTTNPELTPERSEK